MIPSKDSEARLVESTLTGEDVAMGIAPEAMRHIMGVLTNMYEDPELAALREPATNAFDAHVAAGQTRPIEVLTPTSLRPVLSIQDWGTGLNAEDIRRIYSQYGVSTKRESDDFNGMLGIGCKAPLAYADQFTVIGNKDGIRTVVNVARDDEGGGVMTLVEERETDDPNGVTVTIPVSADNDLETKAEDYFSYWKPGTVLLNGQDPTGLDSPELVKLTDEIVIDTGASSYEADILVMGNVPYPVDLSRSSGRVIAWVDIGKLHFAPSREGVQDTKLTQDTIAEVQAAYDAAAKTAIQDAVDAAPSPREGLMEGLRVANALDQRLDDLDVRYDGSPLPRIFRYAGSRKRKGFRVIPNVAPYYKKGASEEVGSIYAAQALGAVWIKNYTNRTFTKPMRERLDAYCQQAEIGRPDQCFVAIPHDRIPMRYWLGAPMTIDWEDVLATKLARPDGGTFTTPKVAGTYEISTADDLAWHKVDADSVPTEKPIYYGHKNDNWSDFEIARELCPDCTLVRMTAGRYEKFQRLYEDAERVSTAIEPMWKAQWEALTSLQQQALRWRSRKHYADPDWDALNANAVDDPDLAAVVRLDKYDTAQGPTHFFHEHPRFRPSDDVELPDVTELKARYPLLTRHPQASQDHLHFYVNAVYAAAEREESST
ncbi:MAG TPA: hypothetical protein VLA89_11130 [Gemmatimonadales bacterium]|nr:hypothetical protein [Gemmatimonadales bacterium]